jgi:hypothetical protein
MMKRIISLTALAACFLQLGAADKPRVSRPMEQMEESINQRLVKAWPDDPVELIGLTQGLYINGYGAVFNSEVNLAPTAGITPFHPSVSKEELVRVHQKKLDRLPKLKEAMQEMLLASADSLAAIPDDEQIVVGVTLFYWHHVENTTGLPAQIVMHAPKKALALINSGGVPKSALASTVTTDEY